MRNKRKKHPHISRGERLCRSLLILTMALGALWGAWQLMAPKPAIADNTVIYPAEGGAAGRAVYSTLIIGENAYGVTEIEGGGLQHIVKQLGAGEDPLNQRATAGWKAIKTAVILVDEYLCRIESTSTYDEDDK